MRFMSLKPALAVPAQSLPARDLAVRIAPVSASPVQARVCDCPKHQPIFSVEDFVRAARIAGAL